MTNVMHVTDSNLPQRPFKNATTVEVDGWSFIMDTDTYDHIVKENIDLVASNDGRRLAIPTLDGAAVDSKQKHVEGYTGSMNELCGIKKGLRRTQDAVEGGLYLRDHSWINPTFVVRPPTHKPDVTTALVEKSLRILYGELSYDEHDQMKALLAFAIK